MINGYLQVGIVAVAVGIIACLISVLRKRLSLDRILVIFSVLVLGGGSLYVGLTTEGTDEEKEILTDQSAADRYFAALYAELGETREAVELLEKAHGGSAESETLLLMSRISVLDHCYTRAGLCYGEYLEQEGSVREVKEEADFLSGYLGQYSDGDNGAIAEYLQEKNLSASELGLTSSGSLEQEPAFETEEVYRQVILERLLEDAREEIEESSEAKQIQKTGDNLKYVYECLQAYYEGNAFDEAALEEHARELNKVLKGKSFLQANIAVREAALVANALLGDAQELAANIDANAGVSELAVATELLVNGYVEEKHFKQLSADRPEKGSVSDVCSRCREITMEYREQLSSAEYQTYENAIDLMESSDQDYILKSMLILLSRQADMQSHSQRSKLYLEIAKGFDYADMDQMVSDYIDLALENAEASDDSLYAEAMLGLLEFISGDFDDSARNVSGYVREALSRLMPVPMEFFEKKSQEEEISSSDVEPVAFGRSREEATEESTENTPESFLENPWENPLEKTQENPLENPLENSMENPLEETSEDNPADEKEDFDFTSTLTEKITQKKSVINIGQIEVESFPMITTRLSFGEDIGIDPENLKDKINLYDCGYPIKQFEARKIDNLTGKIVLLCDLSGSMGGNEGDLRNAVIRFAEGMSENEKVAVIGFSDRIVFQSDFLEDPELVKEYAQKIYAGGGTSVYPTILAAADMFSDDVNDNNIIVVMTDGQDGAKPSNNELVTRLRELVAKHNCTIYTVGIGGADDAYLTSIAELGNGQYLFVDSAEKLSSFYEFMHAQISNSYVVTYKARDTVKNERTLEVECKDSIGSAEKLYYLSEEAANDHDSYAEEKFDIRNADGLQVYGLDTSFMYSTKADVTRTLLGENFRSDQEYTIKLKGNLRSYPISCQYVSATQLEVVIPYHIAVGTYTLELSSEKENCTVKDALVVAAPGSLRQFKFGAYVFTCENARETESGIILSDNVILNGWLHFKGDLEFTGDTRDTVSQYVSMTDRSGAYVKYSRNGSTGLAKLLAGWGITVSVPKLGTLNIYSEPYVQSSYKDFPVQKLTLNGVIPVKGLAHVGGTVALYPDMLYSEAFYTELDLKFLKNVLKNLPDNIFSQQVTGALAVTNTCFLVNASYQVDYDKNNDTSKKFQIGSMGFHVKKLGFDLDTVKEEYSVEASVGFEAFKIARNSEFEGVGVKLAWSGDKLDSVELSAAVKQKITETPVPLYLSKLSIGAENLSSVDTVKDLLGVKVVGGFALETDDIIKLVPKKVKGLFNMDELYLAELDDAKISVTLADFNLSFEANLKLLGIQLAKGSIELGKMDYQNTILGINETEYGADVKLHLGIDPEWKNLEAHLSGDARVTLGYPFGGLTLNGEVGYDLRWFIFSTGKDLYGDFGIGVYWNSNKEAQFIVKAYGQNDKGKTSGFRIDVSKSMGTKKVKY